MSRAVCIICDNGEESLTECVKSLREQTFKARIVIAAGPTFNSLYWVQL